MDTTLIENVRKLVRSSFVDGALKGDKDGVMVVDHVRALHDVGLSRALLPAEVGGGGLDCETIALCLSEVAYVDPSTAISYNMHVVLAEYFTTMPFLPLESMYVDLVENGATICGSIAVPTGESDTRKSGFRFRKDGDGYLVDGKMGFASGSDAASYFVVAGTLEGADEPTLALAFPKLSSPGVTVMKNWDSIGLRATASHDVLCEGLRLSADAAAVLPVAAYNTLMGALPLEAVHRHHIGLATIMGCWLGLCQATLDDLKEFSQNRFGFTAVKYGDTPDTYRSEETWARNRLGHLAYLLETGRLVLSDFTRHIDGPPTTHHDLRYAYARALYHWKLTLDEFITGTLRIGGAHSYVTGSKLGRHVRDLMGCAVMTWRTEDLPRNLAQGLFGEEIVLTGLAGT